MNRTTLWLLLGAWMMIMTTSATAQQGELLLLVRRAPVHGLVTARVDFAAVQPKAANTAPRSWKATLADGRAVPAQFVPDADRPTAGTLVLRLPKGGDHRVRLTSDGSVRAPAGTTPETLSAGPYALRFQPGRMGGLPTAFLFTESRRLFEQFAWGDRVHDPKQGSFALRFDPAAKPELVSDGPVCAVVRTRARYMTEDGKQPPSKPRAVYDWYLFKGTPLVRVTATLRQDAPFAWSELHFLELNFPGEDFTRYAGGDPPSEAALTVTKTAKVFGQWAALLNGTDAIGMFGTDVRVYDGRGEYGTYLHGPWTTWSDRETRMAAWLWAGQVAEPAKAVRAAAQAYRAQGQAVLTRPDLHRRIEAMREDARTRSDVARQQGLWRAAMAERMEAQGRLDAAERLARGALPVGWTLHTAGDFALAMEAAGGGIRLQSLHDLRTGREMLAPVAPPLFTLTLERGVKEDDGRTKDDRGSAPQPSATLDSSSGWKRARVSWLKTGLTARWEEPADPAMKGVRVEARARADAKNHAWRWTLKVETAGMPWSVQRAAFPQVAVTEPGAGAYALIPRGPGERVRGAWERPFSYRSNYPNGWCALQFLAACGGDPDPTGLYFGLHDPMGGAKDIVLESDPANGAVKMAFDHPAPRMGVPGNGFTLNGEAAWQLLRGDWYDAARIYRAWARQKAAWWPKLGPDGRADTPLWMRELCVWALGGGAPADCVEPVKRFAQAMGVPTGFHWYNWHVIPFDNDYPHYFPTKPGVAEGVKDLQASGVHVMPYINGRLWDTHDRGGEDFEFTKVAMPAVTKDAKGEPFTETYGSKETDGSPVRLGVMCPTTALWQAKQREIVLRLMNEVGVHGVYMDQIAAAAPALCMDASHPHPPGGGHWWNEGYWKLVGDIREAMPSDRMLTTECNAEPFVHRFDGYLTWHWQGDGMVPLFPAVYGGAVQMFGRSYGGGPTRDQTLRMKAGQQLVFGEQIGWIGPEVANETDNAAFLRQVVRMRHRFRRLFYAGEMARPPKLTGTMPTVRADWQWYGETWVTTDAVLTGAWIAPRERPRERRLALLFVNVSDRPVTLTLPFDARTYGIAAARLSLSQIDDPDAKTEAASVPARFTRKVTFPPRRVVAWELMW